MKLVWLIALTIACGCGMGTVEQEMGKLGFVTDVEFDNGSTLVYAWSRKEEER